MKKQSQYPVWGDDSHLTLAQLGRKTFLYRLSRLLYDAGRRLDPKGEHHIRISDTMARNIARSARQILHNSL